jgi:hypothetical protein
MWLLRCSTDWESYNDVVRGLLHYVHSGNIHENEKMEDVSGPCYVSARYGWKTKNTSLPFAAFLAGPPPLSSGAFIA